MSVSDPGLDTTPEGSGCLWREEGRNPSPKGTAGRMWWAEMMSQGRALQGISDDPVGRWGGS